MLILKVPVAEINPAPYNPRIDLQPGDPDYEKLKKSIATFGYVEPLVWNQRTKTLISGHQRFKILIEQGITEVEVSVVDLSCEQEKVLNLALNKIRGDWDEDKLAVLLEELQKTPDFDLGLTGFDSSDVSQIFDDYHDTRKDDDFDFEAALNSIKEPATKRGDLIELGNHRILCGDSANPEDIKLLMNGERARLWYTDPPFNCRYTNSRPTLKHGKKPPKWDHIYKDDLPQEEYEKWLEQVLINVNEYLEPCSPAYIWNGHRQFGPMYMMLLKHGFQIGSVIVWAKERFAISYADYNQQVEFCLYSWKKGKGEHFWYGPSNESTLWQVSRDPSKILIHPTQKPVELSQRAIKNSSKRGDIIVETFLGSGSTLIAAENLGRCCFGIEIDPVYCDAIVKRYIAFVGEDKVSEELVQKYLKESSNARQ
jgi:DNA modification methylase